MAHWKLYWVTTPCCAEDCFIIAKSKTQAAALEQDYDPGDAKAEMVLRITPEIELLARRNYVRELRTSNPKIKLRTNVPMPWPDYAHSWLLDAVGARSKLFRGRRVTTINGRSYTVGSFEEA